ncbi:hypothetical protein A2U01_0093046, partial [Trifolium medium]|nr:hypothetical protein [Trifolium medium]
MRSASEPEIQNLYCLQSQNLHILQNLYCFQRFRGSEDGTLQRLLFFRA